MAEYMEVREILEYLDVMIDALSFPLSESGEEVKAYVEGFKEARSVVERFPTADVAPVVHGRFVHDGPRFAGGVDWWHCSSCGRLASGIETRFDYCPHCGARMDSEETDDG